jgi:outer membrane protein assembly factor BamA
MSSSGPDPAVRDDGAGKGGPAATRPRWRRRLLWLIGAVASLLALAHMPVVRDAVRRAAVGAARDRFDTVLTVGRLDYNLLTLSATIGDISAAATRTPGSPFFRADRLTVRLSVAALLGQLSFASIDVVRPRVTVTPAADGRVNLPVLPAARGPAPSVRIGQLSVAGLDLHVEGRPPLAIGARDVSFDLRPRDGHIQGTLVAVNGASFRTPGGEVLDIAVDGVLGLDADAVRIGPLTLSMPDNKIEIEGRLPFAPGPARLDLAIRAATSLETAAKVWPGIGSARGRVIAAGRLAGPLSHLSLAFDVSIAHPAWRGLGAQRVAARGRVDRDAVTLSSAAIDVAGGRITGAATLALTSNASSSARVRWGDIALSGLLEALPLPSAVTVGARLEGDATIDWGPSGLPSLAVAATNRAVAESTPAAIGVGGQASLAVRGSRWTLNLRQALGARTTIAGTLSGAVNGSVLSATTIGGRLALNVHTDDVARAGRLAGVPASIRIAAARVHGNVQAGFGVSGTLATPAFSGSLHAETLRVDGAGAGCLEAVVRIDRRAALVQSMSASIGGVTLHAGGSVPFDRRSMDVVATATVADIAVVMDGVPARWRPSGAVALQARISGPIASPRADGSVTSRDVGWDFWKPGAIGADVHVADGRAHVVARLPSLPATIQGSVSLSSPYAFDLDASLDRAELRQLGAIATGLGAPAIAWTGTARLSVRVAAAVGDSRPVEVAAQIAALDGTANGHPLLLAGPARVTVSGDRIAVDTLRLQAGRALLTASGSLGDAAAGPPLRIEIDGEIAEWWPQGSGRVQGVVSASGSPRHAVLAGDMTVASAAMTLPGFAPFTGIAARARLSDGVLQVTEARAAWSGAALTATGRLPLAMLAPWLPAVLVPQRPATGLLQLHAAATSLTERALEPWLGPDAVSRVTGQAAVAVDLEAPRLAFDALRGTASITQSETTVAGLTLRQPKPARVRFEGGRLLVEDASWTVGRRTLTLGGNIDFRGRRPRVDLSLAGEINLSLGRVFVPTDLAGTATIDARVTGDWQTPSFSGGATLSDVAIGVSDPRIGISGVSGHLTLDGDRLVVSAQGSVNGGGLELTGSLPLFGPRAAERTGAGLRLRSQGALLDWPQGLRSTLDADLSYRVDEHGGVIAGRILVEPGVYRRMALPLPAGGTRLAPGSQPSRFGATRLDISITTTSPGVLDTSYARLEAEADVHVGGMVAEPAIAGKLRAGGGGKVFLRGNVFTIQRGMLTLDPSAGASPTIDLTAETRRAGYDISLRLSGHTDKMTVGLSSDPPLAQPDLMALVTTGSTSNSTNPGSETASRNALVAAISSDVLGLAGRSVGLDTVRVGELDLDLLGDNVDPQMRLTIGKSIASWLDLLLSQNLQAPGLTWVVTVRPHGRFEIRFTSRDSLSESLELRHDVVFGAPGGRPAAPKPAMPARTVPRVAAVSVTGGALPEKDVLAVTRLRTGEPFDVFKWQRDREAIEALFHSRGYLEAQVSATRAAGPGSAATVVLHYEIRRGPLTALRVTGYTLPGPVIEGMKAAWSRSVDDRMLQEDLRAQARAAMIDRGYFWAKIDSQLRATDRPREKTVDVTIVPGVRARTRAIVFTGNRAEPERALRREIEQTGSVATMWREPGTVANVLKAFYRRQGFPAARVSAGPVEREGTTARLPIAIDEGRREIISRLDVRGAGALEPGRVEHWIRLRVGDPFNPDEATLAAKRIQAGYVGAGYVGVRAEVVGAVEAGTGRVTVVATVHPGVRSVIRDVAITGRGETRASVVDHALDLPAGTPASPARIDRAQRRLYDTDAFRSVDITLQPMAPAPSGAAEQPVRAVVSLEEAPRYRLRYGVQVTDALNPDIQAHTVRPGVAAELRRRNLFGWGLSGAVGARYDGSSYSIRGLLNVPTPVLWPAASTLYLKQSVTTYQEPTWFQDRQLSLTYEDRWRLGRHTALSYGYTFSREDAPYAAVLAGEPAASSRTHHADVYAVVAWDTRDSVFNATRGWLHSSSVEYGSPALGSDITYLRSLFQQTGYVRTGPVVLAGAARIGLLVNLTGDEAQSFSLRFRTGGGQSIRGYVEESIHPPGLDAGGRALLVMNGEVRFPVWRWLKGVAFLDAGNAFVDPAHISVGDLKVGTGIGLRLDTPYALFRVDFGFPVPQNSDRLHGRWYFSIGQAF